MCEQVKPKNFMAKRHKQVGPGQIISVCVTAPVRGE